MESKPIEPVEEIKEKPAANDETTDVASEKLGEKDEKLLKNLLASGGFPMDSFKSGNEADASEKNHLFWSQQPQVQPAEYQSGEELKEGEIDTAHDMEKELKQPYPLLDQFEWSDIDLNAPKDLEEVYAFLTENYVEDDDNMFRFDYSKDFLKWALTPPGYFTEWIFAVRVKKSKKMVGFITGIPTIVFANKQKIKMAEINFLCVHKKLRANRLAPVLIKEVTRRVHLKNQWQAIYTAGTLIPTPITQAKYFHRSLNPKKLVDVKFSALPQKQTISMLVKLYKLPEEPQIKGLRAMKAKDIDAVYKLLSAELEKYAVHFKYTQEEIKHWFLPVKDVIYSYVVEKDKGQVTDFLSFYCLPSSILRNPKYNQLRAAYSYYNVATSVPMKDLIQDALILATSENFDVFNCLNIMNNADFLKDLKFSQGDGNLHYYLYNWRLRKALQPSDIGVVLL
jgi:glycylpeptide N-tetradecanoyltransferase